MLVIRGRIRNEYPRLRCYRLSLLMLSLFLLMLLLLLGRQSRVLPRYSRGRILTTIGGLHRGRLGVDLLH